MFEDDYELESEINDDIGQALLDLQAKHNIYFTETNLTWDYAENLEQ